MDKLIVYFVFFLLLSAPQIVLKPFASDVSTVDVVSALILATSILAISLKKNPKATTTEISLCAYLLYVFLAFGIRASFGAPEEYAISAPYLIRTLAIFAPIFIVPFLPHNEEVFRKAAKFSLAIALCAIAFVIAMYAAGSSDFDAHQSFAFDGKRLAKRLGGLTGESGAFSFSVAVIAQLTIVHWFVSSPTKPSSVLMFAASLLIFFLAFKYSVARVILLNFGVFLLFLLSSHLIETRLRFFLFLSTILALLSLQLASISGGDLQALSRGFQRFSFDQGFNALSSGRGAHWENAISFIKSDATVLIFGIGNRMGNLVLGHATENLFIFTVLEQGLVGALLLVVFFAKLLRPIFLAHRSGNSLATGYLAVWAGAFVHSLLNDIFTYYQVFPGLLFATAYFSHGLKLSPYSATNAQRLLIRR